MTIHSVPQLVSIKISLKPSEMRQRQRYRQISVSQQEFFGWIFFAPFKILMHSRCVFENENSIMVVKSHRASVPTLQEMTRIMVHCSKGSTGNVNAVLLSSRLLVVCQCENGAQ